MLMIKKMLFTCLFLLTAFVMMAQNNNTPQKLLRHVVLFSFKAESTTQQIKNVTYAFAALPQQIPQIKTFEWGTNNSPENLNQGFTHCFFVGFANETDRAIYLPHPAHKAFSETLKPILDKVLVLDYWSGK